MLAEFNPPRWLHATWPMFHLILVLLMWLCSALLLWGPILGNVLIKQFNSINLTSFFKPRDFIFEASRVLKVGGMLKIAELESRFQGEQYSVESFIAKVQKFGFKLSAKNLKRDFFYFLDFEKVQDMKKKKKLPDIELKPCLYKKR